MGGGLKWLKNGSNRPKTVQNIHFSSKIIKKMKKKFFENFHFFDRFWVIFGVPRGGGLKIHKIGHILDWAWSWPLGPMPLNRGSKGGYFCCLHFSFKSHTFLATFEKLDFRTRKRPLYRENDAKIPKIACISGCARSWPPGSIVGNRGPLGGYFWSRWRSFNSHPFSAIFEKRDFWDPLGGGLKIPQIGQFGPQNGHISG